MPKLCYSGLITNYSCTAKCKHCMFASAPNLGKSYIDKATLEKVCQTLEKHGVESLHIGGGEPFIDFDRLCTAVKTMAEYGIGIDYVETNGFWCKDERIVREKASILRNLGVNTIMVSLDPFHIEYIPLSRVINFCNAMNDIDMDYFVWQDRFFGRLSRLDMEKVHDSKELEKLLGSNYIADTAREYGIGMNGRALSIASKAFKPKTIDEILSESNPCGAILNGRHCHVDLYANVIPSGCPGISIELADYLSSSKTLDEDKYPVASRLVKGGVEALLDYARQMGAEPEEKHFVSKCHLCYHIRKELEVKKRTSDIAPHEFYVGMEGSSLKK